MTETRAQRRLAGILAADVVGYSRLMGADEAGTLAVLRDFWTTRFKPAVTACHALWFLCYAEAVNVICARSN